MSKCKSLAQNAIDATWRKSLILILLVGLAAGLSTAATASTYALSVSPQANRSGAVALNGSTLNGSVYIFTSMASQLTNYNATGISKVCYWLDNTAMTNSATHCEGISPYDFAGSNDSTGTANAWNANSVASGTHTITQQITMTTGAVEVDTASFKVGTSTTSTSTTSTTTSTSTSTSTSVTVAVSPTSATVAIGTTKQFTATVTGTTSTNVIWFVNGYPGGTASLGTISSTGLYKAPATVPSTSVSVLAILSADSTKRGSAAVTITNSTSSTTSAPSISTTSLPGATQNVYYSKTLGAINGTTPYTWSLAGGALPSGVSLSSSGTISGTPTVTGSFALTIKVTDAKGQTASANETLTVAAATTTSTPTTTTTTTSTSGAKFFGPTSYINTPLPSNPPVDPNSASMVQNSLVAQASAAHLSNGDYGVGLVYSSSSDKVYSIACTTYDSNTCMVGSHINFPIPKGAVPPAGTDHNTSFIYTANDGSPYAGMELDCWIAQYNSTNDTWSCGTASLVHNNSTNAWGTCAEGNITSFHCNGGYAAGVDFAAGPIRPEEIAAGKIPHALVIALSNTGTGITCPATHTDHSGNGIPEGGHFFLPASYNIDGQSWPAWVKTVAHALQTYGGYIVDYGGSFEVKGFSDKNPGSISWSSVGVPVDGWSDLAQIPWDQMKVVTMQSCN